MKDVEVQILPLGVMICIEVFLASDGGEFMCFYILYVSPTNYFATQRTPVLCMK